MKKESLENFKLISMIVTIVLMDIKLIVQGHLISVIVFLIIALIIGFGSTHWEMGEEKREREKWAKVLKEGRQHIVVKDDVWKSKIANGFLRLGELAIIDRADDENITIYCASNAIMIFTRKNFLESYERTLLKRSDVTFANDNSDIKKHTFS